MKQLTFVCMLLISLLYFGCDQRSYKDNTAVQEQERTEMNQSRLNEVQPAPQLDWSSERDNLIRLKKLQNDRSINFFMYVFIEGVADPIGYYQVNKVSSVNSQLTNPQQIIIAGKNSTDVTNTPVVLDSPSEDGSYGTNGDAVFGFTPEGICIQTNMLYITSTVPLTFSKPTMRLAIIETVEAQALLDASKKVMEAK